MRTRERRMGRVEVDRRSEGSGGRRCRLRRMSWWSRSGKLLRNSREVLLECFDLRFELAEAILIYPSGDVAFAVLEIAQSPFDIVQSELQPESIPTPITLEYRSKRLTVQQTRSYALRVRPPAIRTSIRDFGRCIFDRILPPRPDRTSSSVSDTRRTRRTPSSSQAKRASA